MRKKNDKEMLLKYRCVPKIASPEARKILISKCFKSIVVYLKSPRRRREQILTENVTETPCKIPGA